MNNDLIEFLMSQGYLVTPERERFVVYFNKAKSDNSFPDSQAAWDYCNKHSLAF